MLNFSWDVLIVCNIRILEKKTTNFPSKFPWNNVFNAIQKFDFHLRASFFLALPLFWWKKVLTWKNFTSLRLLGKERSSTLEKGSSARGVKTRGLQSSPSSRYFEAINPKQENVFETHHMKHIFYSHNDFIGADFLPF